MLKVFKSEDSRRAVTDFYNRILSSSAAGIREREIPTSFGKTCILQAGDPAAPPLLLIHGTGSNSSSWMGALPGLAATRCVYMADIPGEPGKSEDSRFSCRGLNFSGWILEILDELGLSRADMGGQSLGAWASLLFALHYPQRAGKLVLISPSGIARPRASWLFRVLVSLFRGEKGVREMISLLYNGEAYDEGVVDFYKIMQKHCRYREDAPPLFSDDELKALETPFLYIAGGRDCLLNTEKSAERLKKLTRMGEYRIQKDAGHVVSGWTKDVAGFLNR